MGSKDHLKKLEHTELEIYYAKIPLEYEQSFVILWTTTAQHKIDRKTSEVNSHDIVLYSRELNFQLKK